MGYLTLLISLYIAGIAAWFSILGIMALFSAAPIAAIMMGGGIEAGKLLGISLLYRNWKDEGVQKWRWALLIITFIAIMLTSIGIFGFLSKAHLEQSAPVSQNIAQVELIDQKISNQRSVMTRQQDNITYNEGVIKSAKVELQGLDDEIAVLVKFNKINTSGTGSRDTRKDQQAERERIAETVKTAQNNIEKSLLKIEQSQEQINELQEQKMDEGQSIRQLEVEVGPIKYLAEMLPFESENKLDTAVRFMIVIIMFTFDPMAIVLLIFANHLLIKKKQNDDYEDDEVLRDEYEDDYEDDYEEPNPIITDTSQLEIHPSAKAFRKDEAPQDSKDLNHLMEENIMSEEEWDNITRDKTESSPPQFTEKIIEKVIEQKDDRVDRLLDMVSEMHDKQKNRSDILKETRSIE